MKNSRNIPIFGWNVAFIVGVRWYNWITQNCFINKLLIILKDLWLHFNCWMGFPCFIRISLFLGGENCNGMLYFRCWNLCEASVNCLGSVKDRYSSVWCARILSNISNIHKSNVLKRGEIKRRNRMLTRRYIYFTGIVTYYIWFADEWFTVLKPLYEPFGILFRSAHITLVFRLPILNQETCQRLRQPRDFRNSIQID